MKISELTTIEQMMAYGAIASILVAIISGAIVYKNESEEIKRKVFLRELLGGIDVFFTGKYLNSTGKKWRKPYVLSVTYIVVWFVYMWFK